MSEIYEVITSIASVAGAGISVGVFCRTIKRERRILTIKAISGFREKHQLETFNMTDAEKKEYLKDIEYICIGINNKIYDFKILQKMCGKRLLSQYQNGMEDFVKLRREIRDTDEIWNEYEKVMKKLECHYCSNKNRIQKLFCKKRG